MGLMVYEALDLTCIVTILCHLYVITNHFSSASDFFFHYSEQRSVTMNAQLTVYIFPTDHHWYISSARHLNQMLSFIKTFDFK